MSGNIELSKEAPLDARRKVNTFAELFLEATWKDSNNKVWLYDGMTVEVGDRLGELWQLKSKTSYSRQEDWVKISGGIEEAPKDGNPYMRKNGAWNAYTQIEEVYTFVADINGNKISQDAYNGLKAAVKAGKVIAIKLVDIDGRWIVSLSSLSGDTINLIVYVGDAFQTMVIKSDLSVTETNKNFILRDNTVQYEVTGDYNPAHKKYVDEAVVSNSYKVLPTEVLEITQGMASDDIFNKFGGKSAYLDFVKNTHTNSIIRVEGGALCVASMISYTNDNTSTLDIQTLGLNASQYIRVTVSGGTASALTVKYIFVNESDVLKKNNTTAYTPTQHYHPATKKYVDDKLNDSSISIVEFDYNLVNALINTSTAEEINAAFSNRSQLKTNSIVKLIGINDSSDAFDGSNGYRLCHKVSVNSPDSFIIEYFSDSNNNEVVEIIFTAGNVEVNRMSIAPTIPNDILKFKYINVADGSLLTINKNIQGTEAYDHIVKMFGSTNVIKNTVIDICNNHTKYYIHSYSSPKNCIELSSVYCYYTDTERYEIQFNISYYTTSKPVSKRIAIALDLSDDVDKSDDKLFIEDILVSDNLAAITKKTSDEYKAIGSKDNETMYAITDA